MTETRLPRELVALIHHVELNRSDWWNRAVQQMILAALWLSGKSLSPSGIADLVRESFHVSIHAAVFNRAIEALTDSETLIEQTDGSLKVGEDTAAKYATDVAAAEEEAEKAKSSFKAILQRRSPELDGDETWERFTEELLVPLVSDLGARTYELLLGKTVTLLEYSLAQDFLSRYPEEQRAQLNDAISEFVNPNDATTRSYILRQLNAYFVLEASNLDEGTVSRIAGYSSKSKPVFTIFVDTNFLFSILGVHENPSNEAAELLMALARQTEDHVEFRFYITPITLEEARAKLSAEMSALSGIRFSGSLALAAEKHRRLSGVAQKFLSECMRAGRALDSDDYFRPYVNDLVTVARAKGVELYNEKVDHYRMDQRVIDDINDRLEYEKRRIEKSRRRSYEALLHDMTLLSLVDDLRPAAGESPFEVRFWIATIDFRLLGFDSYKSSRGSHKFPNCIHPTTLVQLLQFWVPRTPQFEQAVLGSLRLPFLLPQFDSQAERVTVRILRALSRFEDVTDLPVEAVGSILMNEALRQRLSDEMEVSMQIEVVREALIEEHAKAVEALEDQQARVDELSQKSAVDEAEKAALAEEVSRSSKRYDDLQTQLAENELRGKQSRARGVWISLGVVIPLIVAALLAVAAAIGGDLVGLRWWEGGFAIATLGIGGAILLATAVGERNDLVNHWRPFTTVLRMRSILLYLVAGVLASVIAAAIYARFS